MDWLCIKIDTACKSSFECEIKSGNLNLDGARLVRAGWATCWEGLTARQFRDRQETVPSALVGDNKGVHTTVTEYGAVNRKGEKRLMLDKVIMREELEAFRCEHYWVNSGHQLSDGLTKLTTSGSRIS